MTECKEDIFGALRRCKNDNVSFLIETIGEENTLKVVKVFSGSMIYIPNYNTVMRENRDEQIRKEYAKAMPYEQVARRYNMSELNVRRIVSQH